MNCVNLPTFSGDCGDHRNEDFELKTNIGFFVDIVAKALKAPIDSIHELSFSVNEHFENFGRIAIPKVLVDVSFKIECYPETINIPGVVTISSNTDSWFHKDLHRNEKITCEEIEDHGDFTIVRTPMKKRTEYKTAKIWLKFVDGRLEESGGEFEPAGPCQVRLRIPFTHEQENLIRSEELVVNVNQ